METVVRHDLPALLRLADSGQIGVSDKTGLATAASLREIDAVLMGGDFYTAADEKGLKKWDPGPLRPIRPHAWPLLLQTGGLAKRNGKRLDLTRKGKMALSAPFAKTVKENIGLSRGHPRDHEVYDAARIRERSRVIAYAIDARSQRYPDEVPYVYRPFAGEEDENRWDDKARARLKDYNLLDLGI